MNLLLFLSALLAGFTGAVSGERITDATAVQQSLGQALEIVAEVAGHMPAPARTAMALILSPVVSERTVRPAGPPQTARLAQDADRVNEQQLV